MPSDNVAKDCNKAEDCNKAKVLANKMCCGFNVNKNL